jgi:bifunctional polynucleotide phosphatase/kinase
MSVLTIGDAPRQARRVCAFDLDGTLITTKSGYQFARSAQDWQWLYTNTLDRLRAIARPDTWIVIISNQKLTSGARGATDKRRLVENKLRNVYHALTTALPNAQITFYAALAVDRYRKPSTGIFEDYILDVSGAPGASFTYIGDAAGRAGDHADSDRKFAYNVHLFLQWSKQRASVRFYTPEEYFLRERSGPRPAWTGFDPRVYLDRAKLGELGERARNVVQQIAPRTLVIMVGAPASGKSTFAHALVEANPDVVYFGLDDMPRKKNYDSAFLSACANGTRSIVVDATNPDAGARERWLRHAHLFAHIRIYVQPSMSTEDRARIAHMNVYRARLARATPNAPVIPDIAYRMFYKRYSAPSAREHESVEIVPLAEPRLHFPNAKDLMYFLQRS